MFGTVYKQFTVEMLVELGNANSKVLGACKGKSTPNGTCINYQKKTVHYVSKLKNKNVMYMWLCTFM